MNNIRKLTNCELNEISGGWGLDVDNDSGFYYGNGKFIFNNEEVNVLQEAYQNLKLKRSTHESIALPEGTKTYQVSVKSDSFPNSENLNDMIIAKLGEMSFITFNGQLFSKAAQ